MYNVFKDAWDSYVQNANIEPPFNQQQTQQQPQPPWPASVDPSLAATGLTGQQQQAYTAPSAYMGGNLPL